MTAAERETGVADMAADPLRCTCDWPGEGPVPHREWCASVARLLEGEQRPPVYCTAAVEHLLLRDAVTFLAARAERAEAAIAAARAALRGVGESSLAHLYLAGHGEAAKAINAASAALETETPA